MHKLIWILWIAAAFSGAAIADDEHHHEELTQDQLGTVHFPVSCTPEAQATFLKGVALLHSFGTKRRRKLFATSSSRTRSARWRIGAWR